MELITADHHKISLSHLRTGHSEAVVLAHGFYNHKDAWIFKKIAEAFSRDFDVICFDFRGHGKSSGLFTWTSKECADLEAVVRYAKRCGYESIGLMGFSLGAAVSLIETAQNPDIKTVIAVSTPSDFWKINYHFWKPSMLDDLKLNIGYKAKGKGVRPSHLWHSKIAPIDIVDRISPRPVLFLHGAEDWLIHPAHSRALYEKAGEPKELVILEKAGHAETMFDQQPDLFMKPCLDWFARTLKEEVKV